MSDVSPELSARLQTLEGQYAENPAKFFMSLASALREAGSAGHAEEVLRENLKRHPGYLSAHVLLGRCLVDRGAMEEATNEFHYVLSVDPQNLVALRFLAEIAHGEGRRAEAERWYGELLAIDPMNAEARRALAELGQTGADAATADQPLPVGGDWPGASEAPVGTGDAAADPGEFGLLDLPSDAGAPAVEGVDAGHADAGAWGEISLDDDASFPAGADAGEDGARGEEFDAAGFGSVDLDAEPGAGSYGAFDVEERPVSGGDDAPFAGGWIGGDARQEPGEAAAADAAGESAAALDHGYGFVSHDEEHGHDDDPEMVTETMAELYAAQGMPERAAEVYRELIQQRGESPALVERLAALEDRMRAEGSQAEEAEPSSAPDEHLGPADGAPVGADADVDDGSWLASVDAFASETPDDADEATEEPAPFPALDFAPADEAADAAEPFDAGATAAEARAPAYAGASGGSGDAGPGGAFAESFASGFAGSAAGEAGAAEAAPTADWSSDGQVAAPAGDLGLASDAAWPAFEAVLDGEPAAGDAEAAPADDWSGPVGGGDDAGAVAAQDDGPAAPAAQPHRPATIGDYFRSLLSWQPGTAAHEPPAPDGAAEPAWEAPAPADVTGVGDALPAGETAAWDADAADEPAPWEAPSAAEVPEAGPEDEDPPFDTLEVETEPLGVVPQPPVDLGGFTIEEPADGGTEAASGQAPAAPEDAEPLPWELPPEEQPGTPAASETAPAETGGFSFEDFFGGGDAPAAAEPEPQPEAAAPAPQPAVETPSPAPQPAADAGTGDEDDEDLESFQAWLQSLKR